MFEQQVEPRRLPLGAGRQLRLEQQVGDRAVPVLVNERTRQLAQGGPVEAPLEGVRQAGAEEGGGLVRVGEHQAEQVVVALRRGRYHLTTN